MNNTVCGVFLDKKEHAICAGVVSVERYGTYTWMVEIYPEKAHPFGAIDKILHTLFVSGCDMLIIGMTDRVSLDEIAPYFESYSTSYTTNFFNEEQQNRLFKTSFDFRTLLTPIEHFSLEKRPLSAQALAHVAYYLANSDLVPMAVPKILESSGFMELGNNALEQLEMVSNDLKAVTIHTLLGKMYTPMGRQLGRFRLFMPICDPIEINARYDWCEWVVPHIPFLTQNLKNIGDLIEKWWSYSRNITEDSSLLVGSLNILEVIIAYIKTHKLLWFDESIVYFEEWILECKKRKYDRSWMCKQTSMIALWSDIVAQIDVAVTSAQMNECFKLARPVMIATHADDHFMQILELRHLLVEERGIHYVTNDIVMGNRDYLDLPYPKTVMLDSNVHDGADIRGVMLYGINSSGKSSLMKSIGIAVILAQSGFYVPAKSMKFVPFEGLYTRIVSKDSIAKSLSTFGVEMLELNTIFAHATPKTLVLGDEISHGTETLSAVAIVASTIIELWKKKGLFFLTTHLHQLSMVQELTKIREVVSLHLSVHYDDYNDKLIYDRRLRAGRGSSVYGLEFAASLHMDQNFLDNAQRLRENLAKEYDILELGHQKETIKRYREVVACECVICGTLIRHQNVSFRIKEHHHLIPFCDLHRRQVLEGKIKLRGFIMTPEGLRLEYETQLEGK